MPDTLTPQELAAIRRNDAKNEPWHPAQKDRRALLAHIDALTAAWRAALIKELGWSEYEVDEFMSDAILRGEP